MYMKLDDEMIDLLCCSFCKGNLYVAQNAFNCESCGLVFPRKKVQVGMNKWENVFDFRIHWPNYCIPEKFSLWEEAQKEYEKVHDHSVETDDLKGYIDETASVKEIYKKEFHISGRVLDVGGGQGRLRHYLDADKDMYVSIDPYINIFERIELQKNLTKAYPALLKPCNFLAAYAEYLPFKSGVFDWVHMRSVVDHFADPYLAFLEASRCARPGGQLMVGLAIMEKLKVQQATTPLSTRIIKKIEQDGLVSLLGAAKRKITNEDDHMYRLTHNELIDLFEKTGWKVTKNYWQKAPFNYCVYMVGEVREKMRSTAQNSISELHSAELHDQ